MIGAPSRKSLFWLLSLGCVGLGCVGLGVRGFALQWQPVPQNLPHLALLASLCACFSVVAGLLLWWPRTRLAAATALAAYFALWTLLLHVPRVAAAPSAMVAWLGLAEIGALAFGALAMVGAVRGSTPALLVARIGMGVCAVVFGISHLAYPDFVAAMVPQWLPARLAWAYATGAGHFLAGLALLSGVRSRLAAFALSAMCGSFVLLVHLPRVLADPGSRAEWTALFVAVSIAGAVLAVAAAPETGVGRRADPAADEGSGPQDASARPV